MLSPAIRLSFLVLTGLGLSACDRAFSATPTERVGYLRELVRARLISGDSLPIDACSMDRFMTGVPAWRDSLLTAERRMIANTTPCPSAADSVLPMVGRFVLTSWYRNWSGEYVIRGETNAYEQGYRFADGVFIGREKLENQRFFAGIADPRAAAARRDSALADTLARDSVRRAGAIADTMADSLTDTSRRGAGAGARPAAPRGTAPDSTRPAPSPARSTPF